MTPDPDLARLPTEQFNPASEGLDGLPTERMLAVFNEEDKKVALAVEKALPALARAVDTIAARLAAGGRLIYIGAGTSGRLGVLDASECPPTFSVPSDRVIGIIAGGGRAVAEATEGSEDDSGAGARDLQAQGLTARDAVVGIAASGRTPYVTGALNYARQAGAAAIALVCVEGSPVAAAAGIAIEAVTGPEVISGSTRLKAGTATKMALNMLSSGAMVRLGHVYSNLMVNVQPKNEKLEDRARRIIMAVTGADRTEAARLLEESGRSVRTAIVMSKLGLTREEAARRLEAAGGRVRAALESGQ
jgi:N-acetylmuramic acid 6-phosphate etherase